MPISCPKGGSARYRWKNDVRLAFCGGSSGNGGHGGTVVEVKKQGGTARMVRQPRARQQGRSGGR